MKDNTLWIGIAAVVMFSLGLLLGSTVAERSTKNFCESVLVTAIQEGKPVMIYNGQPVMVLATLRKDGSTIYWPRVK